MMDRSILETLQKATIEAVAASTLPILPIKMVGRTFNPPNDQRYLEVVFIPNNREGAYWGDERDYKGMLRLILHWPNDDRGAYPPMDVLASVAAYFTKDRHLDGVQISEPPNLTGVLEDGAENLYPASLRYQSFRPS